MLEEGREGKGAGRGGGLTHHFLLAKKLINKKVTTMQLIIDRNAITGVILAA